MKAIIISILTVVLLLTACSSNKNSAGYNKRHKTQIKGGLGNTGMDIRRTCAGRRH